MKRYKSSDLSNNRSEILDEAKKNGVIIEIRKTNGRIDSELVLIGKNEYDLGFSALQSEERYGNYGR